MNKCIFLGRISTDPEIKNSNDGKAFVKFNFAVNRRFHREGEAEADFFQCVAFGKIAETFEKCNVSKGTKLLIESEVRNNNYTDRDGVKHYGTQVVVNSFEFCESRSTGSGAAPQSSPHGSRPDNDGFMNVDFDQDELPFN